LPARGVLAKLGVARISHGPGPYRAAMRFLEDAARQALAASER
jgi:methylisocitrate lyase